MSKLPSSPESMKKSSMSPPVAEALVLSLAKEEVSLVEWLVSLDCDDDPHVDEDSLEELSSSSELSTRTLVAGMTTYKRDGIPLMHY